MLFTHIHTPKQMHENHARLDGKTAADETDDYDQLAMSKQFGFLSNARKPCECLNGVCGCCTGMLITALRQFGCMNITYSPEDFSFELKMIMNDAVLYKSRVTGRNPPPVCVRMPRLSFIKLCASFYDLYFVGRNMHVCLEMGAYFRETEVFNRYASSRMWFNRFIFSGFLGGFLIFDYW